MQLPYLSTCKALTVSSGIQSVGSTAAGTATRFPGPLTDVFALNFPAFFHRRTSVV
jgi:hypothetical protein